MKYFVFVYVALGSFGELPAIAAEPLNRISASEVFLATGDQSGKVHCSEVAAYQANPGANCFSE